MFIPKNMGLFVLNAKLNVIRSCYVPYCLNLNLNLNSS